MPRSLVLGNGSLLVAFDAHYAIRDLTFPRVGQENHVMGRRCRVAVQVDGNSSWIGDAAWSGRLTYEEGSLVGRASFSCPWLGLDVLARDAVDPDRPILLRRLAIHDRLGRSRHVRLWFHHDLDILESDAFCSVAFDPTLGAMLHWKRDRWFLAGLAAPDGSGPTLYSCDARSSRDGRGVAGKIEDGDACDFNPVSIGPVDAAIGVPLTLSPGGSATVDAWFIAGLSEAAVAEDHRHVMETGVEPRLQHTLRRMGHVSRRLADALDLVPGNVQAAAVLSLHVVASQCDDGGAISAANDSETLFPGRESYAYCWTRDGALVAQALSLVGQQEIPRRFFRWCKTLEKTDGLLLHRYWPDGTPGSSWLPRVKDGAPAVPVQEDETALVLWALADHLARHPDPSLAEELHPTLVRPLARALCRFRDPDTGLPLPSFDLWEERFGVHLFTVASVVMGLRGAARLADLVGTPDESDEWRNVADAIDQGVDRYMFHHRMGRYARTGHREEAGYHLDMTVDASSCWLVLLGFRTPDQEPMHGTLAAIRRSLFVSSDGGGIARYENDPFLRPSDLLPDVPGNPWLICTLALAACEARAAHDVSATDAAAARVTWVLDHALPSGLLPEQVHPFTGEALGTAPLTWAHAMLLIAANEIQEARRRLGLPGSAGTL
jgi:GH15 family glucan-1,4-alpha-glucosidase